MKYYIILKHYIKFAIKGNVFFRVSNSFLFYKGDRIYVINHALEPPTNGSCLKTGSSLFL